MTEQVCSHPPRRLYAWTAYDGTFVVCCCECGAVLKGAAEDPEGIVQAMTPAEKGVARKRAATDQSVAYANADATRRGHALEWEQSSRAFTMVGECSCGALVYADTQGCSGSAINSLTHAETLAVRERLQKEMD